MPVRVEDLDPLQIQRMIRKDTGKLNKLVKQILSFPPVYTENLDQAQKDILVMYDRVAFRLRMLSQGHGWL